MPGAGRDLADVVRLRPQLDLRPDRLHRCSDNRVLLLLQHVGHRLRQLRRLGPEHRDLPTGLVDLRLELAHRLLLLCVQLAQLGQLGGELVPQGDLLVAIRLLLRALGLLVREVGRQLLLHLRGA